MAQSRTWIICIAVLLQLVICATGSANQNIDSNGGDSADESDILRKLEGLKDVESRLKRMGNFVRIGRAGNFVRIGRPSSFVRIGKNFPDTAEGSYDDEGYGDTDKRTSSFVRIGRMPTMNRFIRIGRQLSNEPELGSDMIYGQEPDYAKRASSFVRIGKTPSSFVRIGKSGMEDETSDKRASSFVRIGKSDPSTYDELYNLAHDLKRTSQFVRIGRGPSNFVRIGKSPSSFVRIGKSPSSFVRIGKSAADENEKRTSSFVRIGKNSNYDSMGLPGDYEKKASSFVRIGRNSVDDPDFMKRVSSFVRIGKGTGEDKRASSFVRIGKSDAGGNKRASSFVRIGKSGDDNDDNVDDRIGEAEKKPSSFVRIGKSQSSSSLSKPSSPSSPSTSSSMENLEDGNIVEEDKPVNIASRMSGFVRIGKIPAQAFMHADNNKDYAMPAGVYRRGSRGNQSSFVRIGK